MAYKKYAHKLCLWFETWGLCLWLWAVWLIILSSDMHSPRLHFYTHKIYMWLEFLSNSAPMLQNPSPPLIQKYMYSTNYDANQLSNNTVVSMTHIYEHVYNYHVIRSCCQKNSFIYLIVINGYISYEFLIKSIMFYCNIITHLHYIEWRGRTRRMCKWFERVAHGKSL